MAKHVVVLDDNRLILTMAEDFLTAAGYRVSTADEAIYSNNLIYGSDKPDLIIIDVNMPLMSGDTKVKALKRRDKSSDIPVLLMSSRPVEELQVLTEESGADGFICKPFTDTSLVETVNQYLA